MTKEKNLAVDWDELPLILSARDIYENILGINRTAVYEILNREDLPTLRVGKRILVQKDTFRRFLEEKAANREHIATG